MWAKKDLSAQNLQQNFPEKNKCLITIRTWLIDESGKKSKN